MTEQKNSFGSELKKLRKNKKLTVRKLAELSGTSHSYLSQLENDRVNPPKPDMIKKIARGLLSNSRESKFDLINTYDFLMKKAGHSFDEKKYDEVFNVVSDIELPISGMKVIEGGIIKNGKLSISLKEYILHQDIEITVNEKPLTSEEKVKLLEIANTIFD